ncbi:hypothetical protein FNF31_05825 [Cafeteria roenbergensis]|uniref:glutaminase n=1 Tax=Cafeteria roenbergensis TaxID=33653 RepID=A0A5A8CUT6_CAFRO|nr:hypothetical protein FNF31_05825 [Cafeteria roenbergensis]
MPLGVDQFRRSKRDAMPREDLVNLLEGLGIRTTSGYVAREIEQLTRADGQVSLPLSRSHIFTRATQGRLAIPAWNEFAGVITDIADGVRRDVTGGANADYIQVLRDADPTKFAVSVVTVDGQRYNYGDFSHTYSMQSCSKPLTYAIAVDEAGGARGLPFVHSHVGSEASGLAFNSISVNDAGLPHNPMVNAGAIASVGLVGRHCPDLSSRFAYLMGRYREVAGDTEVGFSQATYLCELETAWRNNAILYTLSEAGVFNKRTHPYTTLDLYIQACATEINTETAAMIAATFANGGVQPITGKRVLSTAAVKAALTLCFSCGLYDGSGTWAVNVGLPAKSGVAGLIYVIIPGVAGVAVFSPPLDEHGNSVRAVAFCERLVRTFPFGLFDKAVSDVLSELSPPIDPHMLYLPPHLRRARAVMEAVRNRLRKAAKNAAKYGGAASMAAASAAAAARAGFGPAFSASLSRSTLRSAVGTTDAGNESEDSDDETAWAEAAVFRAQQLGIDVDYGIDYSSAFRLLQEPALDPDKEADADGGGEDEAVSLAPVAPALLLSHSLAAAHSHTSGTPVPSAGAGSAAGGGVGAGRGTGSAGRREGAASGPGTPGAGLGSAASEASATRQSGRDSARQPVGFTSEAIRHLHARLGVRHVIRKLGRLWAAFRALRDWAPGRHDVRLRDGRGSWAKGTARSAPASDRQPGSAARSGPGSVGPPSLASTHGRAGSDVPKASPASAAPAAGSTGPASSAARGSSISAATAMAASTSASSVRKTVTGASVDSTGSAAELFPDVSVVPSAGIEAWRFASFLASKGMACTHANNPRVTFLLVTLARDTGVIRFQDLVLSPVAAADALLLRALLGKLVVDDFQGVRQSIRDMATAVLRFVPPVPIRRDGTVPPSAVAEFNERQRLHQADGMAAAAAAASALSHRGGSTGGRSDAGDAFAAALSAPAPQRRRQVSHGHDSGAGVTGDAATLASEQEEDSADALREAAAIKSAADPLHDLKEQMGSHGAAGAGGAGGAGGGAASGAGAGAGAGTGEDGAGGAGSAAGRYMSDTRRSKVDEHRDALDEELKSVCGVTPDTFGVALCTCDGQYACMGDSTKRVPIMEIAFPLLYAMAMEDSGADAVNAWAGTEPSSHPPDSFTLRDPTGGGHGGGGEDTKDDDEGADGEAAAMGTAEWEALPEDVRLRLEVRGLRRRTRVRRERRRRRRQQRRRWREMRSRGGREALIAEQEEAAATDSETTDSDSAGDESEAAGAGPAASAAAAAAAARERDGKEDSGTDDEAAESLRPQRGQRITQVAPLAPTAQAAFPSGGAGLALDLGAKRRAAPAKSGLAPILGTQARGARAGAGIGGLGVPVAATGAGMAGRAGTQASTVSGLPPMPPPARRFRGVAGTGSAVLHDAAAMGGVDPSRDHKAMPKPGAHRPYNACTLAGALTVMSCVGRGHLRKREQLFKDSGSRFTHVVTRLQEWAGDTRLGFNNAACLLLKQRFLRCLAMAHYLKGMEALPPRCDPTDIAQALVQCMSVEATVRQLATLAATFARAGACPTTDRRCMRPSTVKNTLSMTYTCGMGPISGTWTFNIALPATVGCMGVTLVVIPGLGGLALLDGTKARLDPSRPMPARSLKFCEMLVRQFRVNMFDALIVASSGSGDSGQQITNASEAKATAASAAARRGDLSATLLSFELISASGAGDLDKVMSLIKMGADVSSSDYDARTALHISCCEGHLDIVAELTRQGADPLVRDRWGQTPFAEASRCGHGHIVTFLESHLVSHGQQPPLERHAEPAAGEEAAAHPRG